MDLHIENLSKRFGERLALEIASLTIRAGEFFTFVGPSGCGKSTTLNLIAGLEESSSGEIRLGDRRLNDLPPHRRDVAFVFQSYALYPHRTVRGNLSFPLEMAGTPREEIRRRVEEAAALLGIAPLLEKYPRQLSGGERQRVAVGRAIVRKPQLFLFDEPLSNLDAPLRAAMRKELKRLHQRLGTTFLYVTHDQEEALSLSDRVAILRGGHIQQVGTPRELYDEPANRFVASFFGSPAMNFHEVALDRDGAAFAARVGAQALRWERLDAPVGGKVVLGIRPEHIRLSTSQEANAQPARVALVELHGGQSQIEVEGDGFRLIAVAHADAPHRTGDAVWITLDAARVHVFDAASEKRLTAQL